MKRSTDRILTTHVGSLPRNEKLSDLLMAQEEGKPFDTKVLAGEKARLEAEEATKRMKSESDRQAEIARAEAERLIAIVQPVEDAVQAQIEAREAELRSAGTAATGNAISDLLIAYDPDTGAGTDSSLIPLTWHDFSITPDGSDVTATVSNTFRASIGTRRAYSPYASAPSCSRRNSSSNRALITQPIVITHAPSHASAVPRIAAVASDARMMPV